ncbi:MAG: arginine--tRNA ligase, partial [Pseudomonadota bacterium]
MNLFADIRVLVLDTLDALTAAGTLPGGLATDNVTVEPPRDAAHGDMATNAAMVLAKPAGMKPRDIAEALAAELAKDPRITSAEVAGPGFLNLRLSPVVWQQVVGNILTAGTAYGRSLMGQGARVNVEYVSANPTGPLHVGHTRGAVFGDALASLLDYAGYDVTREYYINDGGAQVDVLARSVYLRYLEAHGQEVAFED